MAKRKAAKAAAVAEGMVRARVLASCLIGGEPRKPGELVDVAEAEAAAHVADGVIDTHADAVAFAEAEAAEAAADDGDAALE